MSARYKVLDDVWVMSDNEPKKQMVYSVTETCPLWGNEPRLTYGLTHGRISSGVGWNTERLYDAEDVYPTREALIESLS